MKSRDTNPSAARADTPEGGSNLEGAPAAHSQDEEPDNGRRGNLPIAVSEGDFSTPTQRTRTITRPRGLRTLETQITPEVEAVPDTHGAAVPMAALPMEEIPRHEASVVDEFLAAPPTPEPETLETPIPQTGPSPTDLWGLSDGAPQLDELPSSNDPLASQEATPPPAAGDGVAPSVTHLGADLEVFADVRLEDHEGEATRSVNDLLDQATAEILAEAPADESPHVVTSTAAIDSFVAALPEPPSPEIDLPVVDVAAPAADTELSPLAQTLANMAEAMHGDGESDVALDASIDLDIADGPLLPLPVETLADPPVRTPAARPTPPPIPTAAAPSLEPSAGVSRAPSAATPLLAVPAAPLVGLPEALVERPRRPKRSKPWFEEVFDESYLRTLPFMTAEQTLQEVDFIESSLGLPRGSEVLDIGCGYGRHAIELVQRGLSVTGVDLSLPLLIRAADESQRRSVAVNFVHTDMREMSFERQFSGAYCMLTSFGYFDDESNLRVAEGIARALKPGGRFLIDVLNRDYIVGDLPARVWWEGDGCVVLEEVDFNFNTNRVLTHRSVVFEDGQQLEQEISVRVYSLHELGKLLRQAGFRVIEVSGSIPTRGHFFGAQSRHLLILAERRSE